MFLFDGLNLNISLFMLINECNLYCNKYLFILRELIKIEVLLFII